MIKTAEQYAKEFKEANGDELKIRKLLAAFISEGVDIGMARGVRNNQRLSKIFDKQEKKWKKFSRIVGGAVKPDGFSILLHDLTPTIWLAWKKSSVLKVSKVAK